MNRRKLFFLSILGLNYYYKDERFRWTLEYTKNKESNYEIKNNAVTLMFQFIF